MARDISNRDVLEGIRESNNSLKEFIKQTNTNIVHLNDNQIAHTKSIDKLNTFMEMIAKHGNKVIWLFILLLAIILMMAGHDFLIRNVGAVV